MNLDTTATNEDAEVSYLVIRTYGKGKDYLHAFCARWGTACMLSPTKALRFDTLEAAEAAAAKAQRDCMGRNGPAVGFTFSAIQA